ncbi:MAG: RluA family pseudouridine synthase [Desulfobulbaceae bacterium]|jgi:tRNA pseudouridine32 synthase/23S rRNA pseudouridine746 synthase|nr:RluA family pseudouridine synthase [Desulfobulbaceae bacterium]
MDILILYHDDFLVVAVKPPGLLAVPGRGADKQRCLVSLLREQFPLMIAQPAVHRLDMATSGLMVVAISDTAHRRLSRQFASRQVTKEYVAVLDGLVAGESGRIELAFRLDPQNRPHQVYDPEGGKLGVSRWRRLGNEQGRSRLAFFPETGRTHQLRLHAAHPLGLGAPVVGDTLYGHGRAGDRLLLHATGLAFLHPISGEHLTFRHEPDF